MPDTAVRRAMYTEEQKSMTGRAMIAMSAAHLETIAAVKALMEFDPGTAHVIAISAAKNLEQAANFLRLTVSPAGCGPMSESVTS